MELTSGCLMVGYTPSIKTTTRTRTFDWTGGGGLGNRNWSSLHPRGTGFDEAKRKEIYAETQRLTQEYTLHSLSSSTVFSGSAIASRSARSGNALE